MTKIVTNIMPKGGTGKTTVMSNLAHALSVKGKRVLLVDFDGQLNLTSNLNYQITDEDRAYSIFDCLVNKDRSFDGIIRETAFKNIDIIPGDSRNYFLSRATDLYSEDRDVVRVLFEDLKDKGVYDYVLIDFNPSISEASLSFLLFTDVNLSVLDGDSNSLETINTLASLFSSYYSEVFSTDLEGGLEVFLEKTYILFNNIDERERVLDTSMDLLNMYFPSLKERVLDTTIRRSVAVKYSKISRNPLHFLDKSHKVSRDFDALAEEVISKW